jgi:hypothetical protein
MIDASALSRSYKFKLGYQRQCHGTVLPKVPTMVHVRLNERETNPNPHINFISVLDAEEENARQLIRALAAQVKPVMKAHGFTVNSLEEVSQRICSAAILKLGHSRLV